MTREELEAGVVEVLGVHAQPWRVDTIMRLADAYAQSRTSRTATDG